MSAPTPSTRFCFLQPDSSELVLPAEEARQRYGVDGFLRADKHEHARCQGLKRVWYFNLGQTTHVVGKVYGVTPVLRPGRRANGNQAEQLPLLGGANLAVYRAAAVEWYPQFPLFLDAAVLADSLLADKSMAGLRASLVTRYAGAAAVEVESELLSRGLTATLLERAD